MLRKKKSFEGREIRGLVSFGCEALVIFYGCKSKSSYTCDEMALYLSYKDSRAALRDKWVHAPSKPREMSNLVRPPVGLHFCSFKFNRKVSGSVFVQTSECVDFKKKKGAF